MWSGRISNRNSVRPPEQLANGLTCNETGKMKIVVEGITADGKLYRGIGSYRVKE